MEKDAGGAEEILSALAVVWRAGLTLTKGKHISKCDGRVRAAQGRRIWILYQIFAFDGGFRAAKTSIKGKKIGEAALAARINPCPFKALPLAF